MSKDDIRSTMSRVPVFVPIPRTLSLQNHKEATWKGSVGP